MEHYHELNELTVLWPPDETILLHPSEFIVIWQSRGIRKHTEEKGLPNLGKTTMKVIDHSKSTWLLYAHWEIHSWTYIKYT